MENYEKYQKAFCEVMAVEPDEVRGLKYQGVENWDSVGHMDLIATLEEEFDIEMEADDIIAFDSFEKGVEILKKYKVDIELPA